MRAAILGLIATFACLACAAEPAQKAALTLPLQGEGTEVRYPVSSVSEDGSEWCFWFQKPTIDRMRTLLRQGLDSSSSHEFLRDTAIGLFCRLVDKNGNDVLRPQRLLGITTVDDYGEMGERGHFLEVTPEGTAVLFVWDWRDCDRRFRLRGKLSPLLVVAVERSGKVRIESLDVAASGGVTGIALERLSGRFAAAFDQQGRLHCFFGGQGDVPADYLVFSVHGADIKVLTRQSFPWQADVPGGTRGKPSRFPPIRWVRAGYEHSDVLCMTPDTLTVAFAPGTIHSDNALWGASFPGETLFTYRFRAGSLALIDSHSAPVKSVSGRDYRGARVPRAFLRKANMGYRFLVPTEAGTAIYEIGSDAVPIPGNRIDTEFRPATAFSGPGEQVISFKTAMDGPISVDWFGFGESDTLFHDSTTASSWKH